jgi:hypothetical protein
LHRPIPIHLQALLYRAVKAKILAVQLDHGQPAAWADRCRLRSGSLGVRLGRVYVFALFILSLEGNKSALVTANVSAAAMTISPARQTTTRTAESKAARFSHNLMRLLV